MWRGPRGGGGKLWSLEAPEVAEAPVRDASRTDKVTKRVKTSAQGLETIARNQGQSFKLIMNPESP